MHEHALWRFKENWNTFLPMNEIPTTTPPRRFSLNFCLSIALSNRCLALKFQFQNTQQVALLRQFTFIPPGGTRVAIFLLKTEVL